MKLGLFGGSFDPFHLGHLAVARSARDRLELDRVLVLPTARPPHKPDRRLAPALARYAMVEIALLDEPGLFASGLEMDLDAESYTVDTLDRVREQEPAATPVLVIGSDSLAELHTWRRWQRVLGEAEIAVVPRPGARRSEVESRLPAELAARLAAARLSWLETPAHPASASEIRRRVAAGDPLPEGWLDARVLRFIEKYSLYR